MNARVSLFLCRWMLGVKCDPSFSAAMWWHDLQVAQRRPARCFDDLQ